jgi:transcriptional regulator with XRE-family HTH domain
LTTSVLNLCAGFNAQSVSFLFKFLKACSKEGQMLSFIGQVIVAIRKNKGINQRDFSAAISCSITHLSMVESGKKKPSLSFLLKVSRVFDVPLSKMFAVHERITSNFSAYEAFSVVMQGGGCGSSFMISPKIFKKIESLAGTSERVWAMDNLGFKTDSWQQGGVKGYLRIYWSGAVIYYKTDSSDHSVSALEDVVLTDDWSSVL